MPTMNFLSELNDLTFNPQIFFKELTNHYPWVGLRWVIQQGTAFYCQSGKMQKINPFLNTGIQLELRDDQGYHAFGSTCELDPIALTDLAAKTWQQLLIIKKNGLALPNQAVRSHLTGGYQSQSFTQPDKLTHQSLIASLIDITSLMKQQPQIEVASGRISYIHEKSFYYNSQGANQQQEFHYWGQGYSCVAKDGHEIQHRSIHGNQALNYQGGIENLNLNQLKDQAYLCAHEARELLKAPNCPQGHLDLILDPDQMLLQIHESIGHPLEIDRILGDERNYAGWSFVKPNDFGHLQYGSPLLNIVFDPHPPEALASYHFDDGGMKAEHQFLIKDGLLVRGLGGAESMARSKLSGVANFRANSWNRAPIDRMANIDMLPGSTSLNEMINQVENGIYMHTNRSWSIDDYRNKFQFGCEYAQLIKDGQLSTVVKNPNYRGECLKFWHSLAAVGNQETFRRYGTPYCGKGEPSQIIRVSHASPVCLFKNVEVFGG